MTVPATRRSRRNTRRLVTARDDAMPATPASRPPREPAIPVVDPARLDDLSTQRGVLSDPFAVFGSNGASANEPPPAWLDDDDEIAIRLGRKTNEPPMTAAVWRAVADVARGCVVVLYRPPWEFAPQRTVLETRRRAASLARLLPAPRVASLGPRPTGFDPAEVAGWRPPTGAVELAAVNLARAVDDDEWTDPEAVAGWVADALDALAYYSSAHPDRAAARVSSASRREDTDPRVATAYGAARTKRG